MPVSKKRVKKQGKNARARREVAAAKAKVKEFEDFAWRLRENAVKIGEYAAGATRRALSLEALVLKVREALRAGETAAQILPVVDEAVELFFVNKDLPPIPGVTADTNPGLEGVLDVPDRRIDPLAGYQVDAPADPDEAVVSEVVP
jgi:hypothetical protein